MIVESNGQIASYFSLLCCHNIEQLGLLGLSEALIIKLFVLFLFPGLRILDTLKKLSSQGPIFCHYCVLLGHDLCQCTQHFAMKKNGDGVEYQYGDWLKSLDGRPRFPSKRDTSQSNGFDNDAGDIPVHHVNRKLQGKFKC